MAWFSKSKRPKISVIMVDGSFRERFHSVHSFLQQSLSGEEVELLWIEYYDRVKPDLSRIIEKYPNARILTLNRTGIYHSSYCFNAGIRESRGEVLFIPDADVTVEKNFLAQAYREHQENAKLVMYFFRLEESQQDHTGHITLDHLKRVCRLNNPQNYGGCLSVRKKWLLEVNGYEQHPVLSTGFHANGREMFTRLKNLGLHARWHPHLMLYHAWHPFCVAPSPLYDVQRIFIDYKAVNLITSTFSGIDPSKNLKFPEELTRRLEKVKRQHDLKEVYEAWTDLKVDAQKMGEAAFAWQRFIDKKESRSS